MRPVGALRIQRGTGSARVCSASCTASPYAR